MKKISILFLLIPILTKAQTSCTFNIYATATKEPIKGATIQFKKIKLSGVTDSAGKRLFINIPNGEFEIEISSVGYKDVEKEIRFPLKTAGNIQIYLEQAEQELDEVTVNATLQPKHPQYTCKG
jgi:hypothetical protein